MALERVDSQHIRLVQLLLGDSILNVLVVWKVGRAWVDQHIVRPRN